MTKKNMRLAWRKSIGMNIVLKRHMGFYVLQVYVPCIMLVILSWVSFFINRESTSDRSCIGNSYMDLKNKIRNTKPELFFFCFKTRNYVCAEFSYA